MNILGEQLKKERERKGITLEEVARVTKIRKTYLQALEDGDFGAQSPVFMKGFLKSYADFLGLDSSDILNRYKQDITTEDEFEAEREVSASRRRSSQYLVPGIITLSLAIIIIITSIFTIKRHNTVTPPVTPQEPKKQDALVKNITTQPLLTTVHEKIFKNLTASKAIPTSAPAPPAIVEAKPPEKTEKSAEKAVKAPNSEKNEKKHSLYITAKGTAWLRVAVDDGAATEVLMKKGEIIDLAANRKFTVVTGNAGEIDITLDGKALGSLGESGKVISKVFPE